MVLVDAVKYGFHEDEERADACRAGGSVGGPLRLGHAAARPKQARTSEAARRILASERHLHMYTKSVL
jgi:hypothetical protein